MELGIQLIKLIFEIKTWEVMSAFALDLIIGDFCLLPHPVVVIGYTITTLEGFLRKLRFFSEKTKGIFLLLTVVGIVFTSYSGLTLFLRILKKKGGVFEFASEAILIFNISLFLALKGLILAGERVIKLLKKGDIVRARKELKALVGRDTSQLDENEIKKAVIESLAENLNDAVIAPLFYALLGGLPLLAVYKAVNTLDSMVGYKNERYFYFGWASARTDDLLNFIPARISAIFVILAGLVLKGVNSAKNGLKTVLKDARKHSSPNSGFPESAVAGVLNLKLGGPAVYFGKLIDRPFIGSGCEKFSIKKIREAEKIVVTASFLFLIFAGGIKSAIGV
ncbi:MAG: cobalamin biosynthesis protein CobD [Thermodesulfobacteria bacterium]|nr:cobalamin biosynthesis protein CobD [Thermodesulfobacteriota bacterium]